MNTMTYTDQIVLALDKHGTLNIVQLAAKISHDTNKTKHIVNLMSSNNKIEKAGSLDGETTYRLTALGRGLAERLHDGEHFTPTSPRIAPQIIKSPVEPNGESKRESPIPAMTESHPVISAANQTGKPHARAITRPATKPSPDQQTPDAIRFGMLDSRELIILLPHAEPIILAVHATDKLRQMLGASA